MFLKSRIIHKIVQIESQYIQNQSYLACCEAIASDLTVTRTPFLLTLLGNSRQGFNETPDRINFVKNEDLPKYFHHLFWFQKLVSF